MKQGEIIKKPSGEVPSPIHGAYRYLVAAETNFNKALKKFAPTPPVNINDKVYVDIYGDGEFIPATIESVRYNPYSGISDKFGGWRICFSPVNKDFSQPNRTRYGKWNTEKTIIKKAIS